MNQAPWPLPDSPNPVHALRVDRAVLDTQVVLDWLVFRDPRAQAIGHAIEAGSLRWLASLPMLVEFEQVLDRGVGAPWLPDRDAIRRVCSRLALPAGVAAASTLRCADPDDQMFIDLALAGGARWLFTRDKALLRLARRARDLGVLVRRPADWPPQTRTANAESKERPPAGGL